DHRTYYYLCLALLTGAVAVVASLRRSGIGRTIIAVRDNDRSAASFTVSPALSKLTAFAVAGGLAALGGALLAGATVQVSVRAFGPEESLRVVAMTIIGGLGSITGALLGAVYLLGLPALIRDSPAVRLLTSGIGLLVLLMYVPHSARDAALRALDGRLARRDAGPASAEQPRRSVPVTVGSTTRANVDGPALHVADVVVHFGGVVALDRVTLDVRAGEVVGLIGSNGAGKSTLLNVVSGFIAPDAGTVEVFGTDVTGLAPHHRARFGMGRVFQDAR